MVLPSREWGSIHGVAPPPFRPPMPSSLLACMATRRVFSHSGDRTFFSLFSSQRETFVAGDFRAKRRHAAEDSEFGGSRAEER